MHDSLALKPLVRGIPAVRSRRGPQRRRSVELRADKASFSAEHLAWLRERGLVARSANTIAFDSMNVVVLRDHKAVRRRSAPSGDRLAGHRQGVHQPLHHADLGHRC
ncbi:hypothetical protein ACWD1Y_16395 [Streptomyces sp. NPDC002814]